MYTYTKRQILNTLTRRQFSSALATQDAAASNITTLWQYSEQEAAKQAAKNVDEAAYLKSLRTAST